MSFSPTGTPQNYTVGGLQFLFWEEESAPTGLEVTAITDDVVTVAGDQTGTCGVLPPFGYYISSGGSCAVDTKVGIKLVSAVYDGVTETDITLEDATGIQVGDDIYIPYGAYQQFGNIVSGSFSSDVTYLDHYSAKTGTRVKDRTVPNEINVTVNLTVDEPTPELMNLFTLGGSITDNSPTDKKFNPFTEVLREGAGKLYGVSDTGNEFYWEIPYLTVKPDGEFTFDAENYSEFSFIVEALSDTKFTASPYGTITHVGLGTDLTPVFQ